MHRFSHRPLCAALVTCSLAAATAAPARAAGDDIAAGDDTKKLLERIAELEARSARSDALNSELEARLAAIEAEQRSEVITQQRADEIRALVHEVLADADTRASMLQNAAMAGYDNGFFITSSDGNWLLRTNMLMQQRFVLNRQDESLNDDNRWGFENSRTRFTLSGHLVQPDFFYHVDIEVANNDAGLPSGENRTGLQEAYAGYDFGQGWRFWIGTITTPLLREELVDAGDQLLVERSLVNYLYTGGYTDGLAVRYRNDLFNVVASYNNGVNDGVFGGGVRTGGTSPIFSGISDYAFTFRGEWLIKGDWDTLTSLSSPRGGAHAMMLGGAVHFQSADASSTGVNDLDLLLLTADFSGQFGGTSVFAAIMYSNANQDPAGSQDSLGFVGQVGHFISPTWELFGRFEHSSGDIVTLDDVDIFTFGFTKWLADFSAKWTTDFGFALDTISVTAPITGWRADLPGEDKQVVVRSQFQIRF